MTMKLSLHWALAASQSRNIMGNEVMVITMEQKKAFQAL